VHHGVQDVRARLPLVDSFDPVTLEFGLEGLVEIDLGAFAQLFGRLLLVGALQFLELGLDLEALLERSGLLGVDGVVDGLLPDVALFLKLRLVRLQQRLDLARS
jgi:hypothetical protein